MNCYAGVEKFYQEQESDESSPSDWQEDSAPGYIELNIPCFLLALILESSSS